jgi:hypothetical protein
VEELAKSPVTKISISRAEPDLRGPVGAPSGNDRYLRIPSLAGRTGNACFGSIALKNPCS